MILLLTALASAHPALELDRLKKVEEIEAVERQFLVAKIACVREKWAQYDSATESATTIVRAAIVTCRIEPDKFRRVLILKYMVGSDLPVEQAMSLAAKYEDELEKGLADRAVVELLEKRAVRR